jgi:myo-inositol 2-dehydrogenase/D-chiro-inositol 1-dehydrogenase
MYEDPEVDSVIVATPTNTHEKIITGCLQSGKAVFTEKPVAATPEEMGNVYQLAKQVGKPLFCGFNRRFDPSFNRVYQDIRKGHIGQILQIKLTSRDSPLPPIWYLKTSGGIFYDCMVHDLDLMTHLLGEFPIEVFAMAVANFPEIKEIGEHDSVVATFKYQSGKTEQPLYIMPLQEILSRNDFTIGTIGVVDVSRHCPYGHDQRIEVFGHKGMLQVENDNPDRGSYFTADGITRSTFKCF